MEENLLSSTCGPLAEEKKERKTTSILQPVRIMLCVSFSSWSKSICIPKTSTTRILKEKKRKRNINVSKNSNTLCLSSNTLIL